MEEQRLVIVSLLSHLCVWTLTVKGEGEPEMAFEQENDMILTAF